MTDTRGPPSTTEQKRIAPRWVGVVFPIALLGAAAILALQAANRVWLPITVTVGAAAGLGLVAGFSARWSVRSRSHVIQWSVAMGGLTVGLLAASLFSNGAFGVGPLYPLRQEIDWIDVAQLSLGALAAWLALRGYSRPRSAQAANEEGPGARRESTSERGLTPWLLPDSREVEETRPLRARRRPAAPPVLAHQRRPAAASAVRVRTGEARSAGGPLRTGYHRLKARLAQAAAWRPRLGFLSHRRADTPIRFTGPGEDRCPYCLDVIDPKDKRGVKTCPACHTPHHADCWSVTGMCQMPHLYGEAHATRPGATR